MKLVLLLVSLGSAAAFADVASLKTEPNLERRSERALVEANDQLDAAKKAYALPDDKAFQTAMASLVEAVQISYDSLRNSGKSARKHPKYFKRADQQIRELLRRLDGLEQGVAYDDRTKVASVKDQVERIDEQIVLDIMKK